MSEIQPVGDPGAVGETAHVRPPPPVQEVLQVEINVVDNGDGSVTWKPDPATFRIFLRKQTKTVLWRLTGRDAAGGVIPANRLFFSSPAESCSNPPTGPRGRDGVKFDRLNEDHNAWLSPAERDQIDRRLEEEAFQPEPGAPTGGLRAYRWVLNPVDLVGRDGLGGHKLRLKYDVRVVLDGTCHVLDPEGEVEDPPGSGND